MFEINIVLCVAELSLLSKHVRKKAFNVYLCRLGRVATYLQAPLWTPKLLIHQNLTSTCAVTLVFR